MTAERIWIWLAENGNIRKWDRKPFDEGVEYVLASAAKDDGWRPIESAPMDGTEIALLTEAGSLVRASWQHSCGLNSAGGSMTAASEPTAVMHAEQGE